MPRLAPLVVAAFAASSGCTCSKKERTVTTLSGPVEATVAEVDRTMLTVGAVGAPHVGGILYPTTERSRTCELRVSRPRVLSLDIGGACLTSAYELAADPEGRRLAFRPTTTPPSPYSLVYFGSEGRSFEAIEPYSGEQPIDWAAAPTLDSSLDAIYEAHPALAVLEEVRSIRGAGAIAAFLVKHAAVEEPKTTDDSSCEPKMPLSSWRQAYEALSPDEQRRVARELVARLGDEHVPPLVVDRATALADRSDPASAASLAKALERGSRDEASVPSSAFARLLHSAAKQDSKRAAALGCARLAASSSPNAAMDDVRAALVAIVDAGARCDAVRKVVEGEPGYCRMAGWYASPDDAVPMTLASSDAAIARAHALAKAEGAEASAFLCHGYADGALVLTAAVRATGARDLLVPVERFTYRVDMPASPRCFDLDAEAAGTPCHIDVGAFRLGGLSCDPDQRSFPLSHVSDTQFVHQVGDAHIDDERRVIRVVRSTAVVFRAAPVDGGDADASAADAAAK